MQAYSDPSALPDVEVFQLTAAEVAELDEDTLFEYSRKHEFRLASMNSRVRDAMIDAIVADLGIDGGWFYWYCFPGCMPESRPFGPYKSADAARQAAIYDAAD
jgi:hypothetical protein